jgi:hypothetical protein
MTQHPAWYFDEMAMGGVDFADLAQVNAFEVNWRSPTLAEYLCRKPQNHAVIDE